MANFQMPIEEPKEIIPRLGKEGHWQQEPSAFELATSWMKAKRIPDRVRQVLDQAPDWRQAELLDAIFERKTEMPGRGGSATAQIAKCSIFFPVSFMAAVSHLG